jgi:CheY-like chemotaxis protein
MKDKRFILLVEDSEDDALLFARVVSKADLGIEMHRVHNGQEAIDYLLGVDRFADRKQFPFPHVVVLDLRMPICDGFDFLEWRRSQPSLLCLPTIVMSSSRFDGDIGRSYALGANAFSIKVQSTDSLRDRVEALRTWWFEHCALVESA